MLVVVALADIATGQRAVVLSLVVVAPLLAASLLGPLLTAGYAFAALVVGAVLGAASELYVERRLGDQLVRLLTIALGGVLAVATAYARVRREERLARVLRVAAVAQQAILPAVPEQIGPLRLAASYDSAAQEAAIGGDLYAAVPSPFGVRLLIGDVRGKGLDAVRLASAVVGAFRERAHDRSELAELVRDLDRAVIRAAGDEDFVTAAVAQVSGGELLLVNAGHVPPLLVRAGVAAALAPTSASSPLGLGVSARPVPVALEPGDRLLLYTDGITEARRPTDRSFFPLDRVVVPCLGSGTLPDALQSLRAAVTEWVGGTLQDDVALLAVEYAPGDG
ncbi:serine/threonine-protein phosphatase [Motilibacter sp. E257]|uniref:Serine/threonine-protein phosphatase n=1 Tax=Motilibacter deserti TaxID=2714956 RepID=A0ABX0GSY0_9ACTN|nr:serine/threonine-protein phosphatase [Motilibacter deserti]